MLKLLSEVTSDYNSENLTLGNEISELLDNLEIGMKSLPADIKEQMQTVVAILKSEGLSSVDELALQLCLEKKKIENKMKEREDKLLKVKYNAVFARYNTLEEKINRIQEKIEKIDDTLQSKTLNDENEESERILLSNKVRDYKETVKKLKQELEVLNGNEIDLDQTMLKSTQLSEKLEELSQINNILEEYKGLPPNLLDARKMLEFKKQELKDIEKLLYEKMND